ncbi:diguanylate cyclase [Neobacillus sp. YX16]|uniref:sensor domain-containing diguanylate cyclase n=1 Tax=Neobacillus sp. YX16 TaxID=3047874 RepID=UPI0024C352F3|nr:sensor domain-containing diguanylate cyclase [Neobacillus sp. YX16]WHZ04248.1 diguanylate cyclase [Neobacillus sp. YX16]
MVEKYSLEILNRPDLFYQLINNMTDLVFLTKVNQDKSLSYVILNKPAKDLYGLTNESFGRPIEEVLPSNAYHIIKRKYEEAIEKKQPIKYEDMVIVSPLLQTNNHGIIYWESTITPVFNQDGVCTHLLAIVRNLTEQREKENEIQRIKDRLELVWNSVADVMFTFDKNEDIVSVNKAFEKLLGWKAEDLVKDKSISFIPEDDKEDLRKFIERVKNGETVTSHEVKRIPKSGEMIYFLGSFSPLYDQNGDWDGGVVAYKNITERKKYEDKLKELALHDPLTGFPNRTYFSQCLKIEMEKAKLSKLLLSVFALDIDHFKEINDTYGHDIGDEVLKEFAKRVKRAIRKNDFLARIGGDEFVILIPELTEKTKVVEMADRIQQCLGDEWIIANEKIKITSSIGISFYNQFDSEEKTLFKNADLALYEAKKKGRNNYQIYNDQKNG